MRPPTLTTQRGVATALKWPLDWLEVIEQGGDPPTQPDDQDVRIAELQTIVREQAAQLAELTARVTELDASLAQVKRAGRQARAGSS